MSVSTMKSKPQSRFAFISKNLLKYKESYFLVIPGLVWYAIFAYVPILGLSLAFKTFKANLGILGSPWVGLLNYEYVFRDKAFMQSVFLSLQINAGRLLFVFPYPIILALFFNEIRLGRSKKLLQSIFTFPHFLSWVIVSSVMISVLGQSGLVNAIVGIFGGNAISFLGVPAYFQPIVYITDAWKTGGWSAIIYMAAIAGIDVEQFEAAEIDGATRLQRIAYITLPGIKNTIIVLFILAVGNIMTAGFDQIFNLSNPATLRAAEVLDMYIYRITFQNAVDFSFSTAVSLFRSVINLALLFSADRIAKLLGGSGLIA